MSHICSHIAGWIIWGCFLQLPKKSLFGILTRHLLENKSPVLRLLSAMFGDLKEKRT